MKEIDIEIDEKTGEIKVETLGFKGKECEDVLEKLQKELQAVLIQRVEKPEKLQKEVIVSRAKQTVKKI